MNKITNEPLDGTFSITEKDLQNELKLKNINTANYTFQKKYQIIITYQNGGQTTCIIEKSIIKNITMDGLENITLEQPQKGFNLEPKQNSYVGIFGFNIDKNALPSPFAFDFEIYYRTLLKRKFTKKVNVSYNGADFHVTNIDN